MGFPNFPGKYLLKDVFSPEYHLKCAGRGPFEAVPKGVVLYTQDREEQAKKFCKMSQSNIIRELSLLENTDGNIGVAKMSMGAPAAAFTLERLIAVGCKKFVMVGIAGGLQPNQNIGDLIVCSGAIRDEGTSYHYAAPSKYAYPSEEITEKLEAALKKNGNICAKGASWTTDAFYRETAAEVEKYRRKGVLTVEMEASALFAIAEYRGAELGAAFVISDVFGSSGWAPNFGHEKVNAGFKTLHKAAVDALLM